MTGPIIVDDVVYEKVDDDLVSLFPSKELVFRRLTFQRSEGLVQSEALLTQEGCQNVASGKEQKTRSSSKSSKKKGNQRRNDSLVSITNGKDYSFLCSFSLDFLAAHAYLLEFSFVTNAAHAYLLALIPHLLSSSTTSFVTNAAYRIRGPQQKHSEPKQLFDPKPINTIL